MDWNRVSCTHVKNALEKQITQKTVKIIKKEFCMSSEVETHFFLLVCLYSPQTCRKLSSVFTLQKVPFTHRWNLEGTQVLEWESSMSIILHNTEMQPNASLWVLELIFAILIYFFLFLHWQKINVAGLRERTIGTGGIFMLWLWISAYWHQWVLSHLLLQQA